MVYIKYISIIYNKHKTQFQNPLCSFKNSSQSEKNYTGVWKWGNEKYNLMRSIEIYIDFICLIYIYIIYIYRHLSAVGIRHSIYLHFCGNWFVIFHYIFVFARWMLEAFRITDEYSMCLICNEDLGDNPAIIEATANMITIDK